MDYIFKGQLFSNSPSFNDQYIYINYSTPNMTLLSNLFSDEEKFQSKLHPAYDIVFGTLLVIVGLVSLVGNSASLAVFYFRRRQISPGEIFLANLSVVDIVLSVASYPAAMISAFHHEWIFGRQGCVAYGFVCYFLGIASLGSIVAIAVIRYLKTCRPSIGNQITWKTSIKILLGVYFYSLLWAVLPLNGIGNYELEPFNLSCTLHWTAKDTVSRVYMVLVSFFWVCIPTSALMYCYRKITLLVGRSDRIVGDTRTGTRNISEAQLTRMSLKITIGFLVGWGPYTVVSLYGAFTGKLLFPMWLTPLPVFMAKSSIAYNPIIYIFGTPRYRNDFYNILRTLFPRWNNSFNAVASNASNNNRNLVESAVNEDTTFEMTTQLLNPSDRRNLAVSSSNYLGIDNSQLGSSSTTTSGISASIQTTAKGVATNEMDQSQFQSLTGQDYENYDDSIVEEEAIRKGYKVSQV